MDLTSGHAHDPRQRHSYELRPAAALDRALREIAFRLEAAGLIEPGASTAPRFHPHLTLIRASVADADLADALAHGLADPAVTLDEVGTFGDGRIIYLASRDPAPMLALREQLVATLEPEQLDPIALRRPWQPHVTVAYAVPEPHRDAARAFVEQQLPVHGRWETIQCWDLDVRPTRLLHAAAIR